MPSRSTETRTSVVPLVVVLLAITALRAAWTKHWAVAIPAVFTAIMFAVCWAVSEEES